MTYTPPEGVTIGAFTTGTLPASFSAPVNSVVSYKIYGTEGGAGEETENIAPTFSDAILGNKITFTVLSDNSVKINGSDASASFYGTQMRLAEGTYSMKSFIPIAGGINSIRVDIRKNAPNGSVISDEDDGNGVTFTVDSTLASQTLYFVIRVAANYVCDNIILKPTLVTGSTIPTSFIPKGYKIPISLTGGTSTSNYNLFIGDSKLSEDEYVDFTTQKIYKMQEGELTPTDPPLPLPSIITYDGENMISSTETLGDVELTGEWTAIMGSTEDESIDIEFTVDAEEYIAFVTVDDDPSIQVSDTITMPASASSFTLQVVSWGREQYIDTVYNALS